MGTIFDLSSSLSPPLPDIGGRWVHLTCALYTPGITFGDVDNLSAVSWQEIDFRTFGKKVL